MVIKKATQVGNPIIRRRSRVVGSVNTVETRRVVKNLVDSMHWHELVGMAAPQIGENLRIFVTEVTKTKYRTPSQFDGLRVFINPRIIEHSKNNSHDYEGCGSVAVAGIFAKVTRPTNVVVEALDREGKKFRLKARGLLARIIQHEMDHLDGKIFLDRPYDPMSLKSRDEYMKYKKARLKRKV
ncbi:MAG TPA: peptide deformylase [Candidatus Paceibacterota bacterium]